jgi:hypothetical protein
LGEGEGMSKGSNRVAAAWAHKGYAVAGNMATRAGDVWSYGLLIGFTDKGGELVALDYTRTGTFNSVTTSAHVNAIKAVADRTEAP